MTDTPRLGLPYIAASQYQKEVTHSMGLDRLDLLCQCAVLDRNLITPPASPTLGDAYIVGASATDAWAGHDHELALWVSSQWELIAPLPGFQCWVIDEAVLVYWSGTAWTIITGAGGGAITFLGLTDTPATYSGQAGKTLLVNPGETALEFGTTAGSAPVDAPYVVTATHALLSAERVVTDTSAIVWDTSTAGQLKATLAPEGVTLDKLAHQPQGTLLGRGDTLSPTDEIQALTVGPGLTLEGTTLSAPGSGVSTFLGLTDTPDAYTGQAGKAVIVNAGATALEFGTAEAGASDFLALTDTPDSYTGQAGKVVAVNAGATALEFITGGSNAALGAEVQRVAMLGVVQNTNVPVAWDTEVRDDAAFWDSGAATRLTIPSAGWYSLTAFVQWDATSGVTRIVNVRVNGTQYIAVESTGNAGVDQRQTIAVNWYLGAGDYLEIVLFQSTAGTRQITGNCTVVGLTAAPDPTNTFLALTDTPDAYTGQGGNLVRVNAGATATEFTAAALAPASGTALSVVRYASSGQVLEATPGIFTSATGLLGLGTPAPTQALHLVGETLQNTTISQELYLSSASGISQLARKARGTLAAPLRVAAGDVILSLQAQSWSRDLADTTDTFFTAARLQIQVDTVDASGRMGSRLALQLAPGAGQPVTEVLRVTQGGNLLLGTTSHGTDLAKGLVVASGTAPSGSHPADAVQLWSADTGAVAGKAGLHVRTEDGTSHVLGDLSGIGTLCNVALGGGATYRRLNVFAGQLFVRQSSVQERAVAAFDGSLPVATDATRTSRLVCLAYDATAGREAWRVEADGTAARLGFYGATAVVRQSVPAAATDATTTQALVNSLRSALIALGLCV